MTATVIDTLPIVEVSDGYVLLGGYHPTADGLGQHNLLRPVVALADLAVTQDPAVGDSVARYDDGSAVLAPLNPEPPTDP